MSLPRFTIYYIVYGFMLALLARVIASLFPQREILASNFWQAFVFLFLLTYIAYIVAHNGMKRTAQAGVMAVMGSIVLKLLVALSFVLFVLMKTAVNQLVFALNYFSLYLLFSLFEVMCLLRNLRNQNKK
ncbi:hypothetical protein GCM10023231_27580 [Olivibacter ginsenosidimutans]|uniref:ATP synthase subunit I n=1 Tax=Olivibacter ginsenosidimutans TaxID=1176537 RepID=A0ABP9BR87_9SPHI